MSEVPKGFKRIDEKLTAFSHAVRHNAPSDGELKAKELKERLTEEGVRKMSHNGLYNMITSPPSRRPDDDVHYLSAVTRLYRKAIKERPEVRDDAVVDLANSKLLQRVNAVLKENGHSSLTRDEVEKLLTGEYEPVLTMHAKGPTIIRRLEEYGKRDAEIQWAAQDMLSMMHYTKIDLSSGKMPLTVDSFVRNVENIHGLAGCTIEATLNQTGARWNYDKSFTTDLFMHRLEAKKIGHERRR